MTDTQSCGGKCGTCANAGTPCAAAKVLELTEGEIRLLGKFAQIPFWPVGRRADAETPVCLEDGIEPEALAPLALKGLIRLDFDIPLTNFDYAAYADCTHKGSMALTAAGQSAIELLDIQGADE